MRSTSARPGSARRAPPAPLLVQGEHRLLWAIGGISIFTNLLMLTGPVFMLQVYDRVLSSGSAATLTALFTIAGFLYLVFGLLDHARARIGARLGAQVQDRLDGPLFRAALRARPGPAGAPQAASAPADLALLRDVSATPGFMALFDFPWVPLFIAIIALLHPWLGALACAAALSLAALGAASIHYSRARVASSHARALADRQGTQQIAGAAGQMQALGLGEGVLARWQVARGAALDAALAVSDLAGGFAAAARALRLFLQSAILAAGALLVLQGQLTAGGMIAASIILGRALAPLDQLVGAWPQMQAARDALDRLRALNAAPQRPVPQRWLPAPAARLSLQGVTLAAPLADGALRPVLRQISFEFGPGQVLGVAGPSGAGKSSLAAAAVGLWPPQAGEIRLDGARLAQYPPDQLAAALGFLPQRACLYDGTLRDNIARFDAGSRAADVVAAARAAGAHEMILSLPDGYDTQVTGAQPLLSGGQLQRIALARALYRDPVLLVLDEPEASLDADGLHFLDAAIRTASARGAAVLLASHHPALLAACDRVLRLSHGGVASLGRVDPSPVSRARRRDTEVQAIRFAWEPPCASLGP